MPLTHGTTNAPIRDAALSRCGLVMFLDAGVHVAAASDWGDRSKALDWLDTAMRVHDAGLEYVKTEPFFDLLRKQPRFQAIERQLKFTN